MVIVEVRYMLRIWSNLVVFCRGLEIISFADIISGTPMSYQEWGYENSFIFPVKDSFDFVKKTPVMNQFHIWQVSPQLSCGDTCQIWTRYA